MPQPVLRVSRGRFPAEKYEAIKKLIEDSATPLVPAIEKLQGLLYYHAAVDTETTTIMNISAWESLRAAKQLDTLQAMLAQRPILEAAGVTFDKIANDEALWVIERAWRA